MSNILKERARELFESVVKNTGFFGDFYRALSYIEQGEAPYMWVFPYIAGIPETRVLVTDRRILIFRVKYLGPRLKLVAAYDLHALSTVSVTRGGDGAVSLILSFNEPEHASVSLNGLSTGLAEQAKRFFALSDNARATIADQSSPTTSLAAQEFASVLRPAEERSKRTIPAIRVVLPGLSLSHTTKHVAYLGFGLAHSVALSSFSPVEQMLDCPFTAGGLISALMRGVFGIFLLLLVYFGPGRLFDTGIGLFRVAAGGVFLLMFFLSRPPWITPYGWASLATAMPIIPAFLGALLATAVYKCCATLRK